MVYDIKTVPEDTPLWCTGFRFDDTKAGINCKPVQGTIHNKDYWKSKFKTKNRTISVNANQSYYAFADTYEELDNRYHKIASSLEGCYLSNDSGVMY